MKSTALEALARNVAEAAQRHIDAAKLATDMLVRALAREDKMKRAERMRRRIRYIGF